MNKLVKYIIKHKPPCFFISPHFDDAALSAGCLMHFLAMKGVSVTVINVFTKASSGPQTLSARRFVNMSGYANAEKLFRARRVEDEAALVKLGAKVINLDHVDSIWRRRPSSGYLTKALERIVPEVSHIYPIHRIHVKRGKVSQHDKPLVNNLSRQLIQLIPKDAIVFCPEAIGGHVDHTLVKTSVMKNFNPIRWLDQPYLIRGVTNGPVPYSFQFPVNNRYKKSLINHYRTQVSQLFPHGKMPLLKEKFIYD